MIRRKKTAEYIRSYARQYFEFTLFCQIPEWVLLELRYRNVSSVLKNVNLFSTLLIYSKCWLMMWLKWRWKCLLQSKKPIPHWQPPITRLDRNILYLHSPPSTDHSGSLISWLNIIIRIHNVHGCTNTMI